MGRINSRNKGNKNERNIAKLFTEWTGVEFVRVPRSGGLHWKSGMSVTGDLIPSDPFDLVTFPFSIEAKFYNAITFQDLILPNKSDLQKFYDQSTKDADSVGKYPLVLFRYNRMPRDLYFVMMGHKQFVRARKLMDLEEGWFNYRNDFVIFTSDNLFDTDFDEFLDEIKFKPKRQKGGFGQKISR